MQSLSDHIQIATTNYRGRTVFTCEYGYYLEKYSWEAKAFIAHCISQWSDEFEHVLDYWEEDSVGKPLSPETNLYQYTGNNPVNYIDPLGLWYTDIGFNIPIHPIFGG
ncbi:MAG: hypothetical protein HZC16_01660, partial [Candidatus Omnitrophica bacterium]|nr:hypothetical protein [Candidatus Omnitrophota bacterium]